MPPQLKTSNFMDRPEMLRQTLEECGALQFTPFPTGLFPASELTQEMAEQTEMDYAWLRDNAHVGHSLYEHGRPDLAIPVGAAMLRVVDANRQRLTEVAQDGKNPWRMPVRFDGITLANDTEQRVQHDSTGYLLGFTSRLLHDEAITFSGTHSIERALSNTELIARYLRSVEYWRASDAGHWEENHAIHASSIGVVVHGLQRARALFNKFDYQPGVDMQELIENGTYAYTRIMQAGVTELAADGTVPQPEKQSAVLWPGHVQPHPEVVKFFQAFNPKRREHDAALLFLAEPFDILDEDSAAEVVAGIKRNLMRERGFARYTPDGDTYWGPGFKEILNPTERTRSAEGRLELRNLTAAGVAYSGTEAQWTLFDPILSAYHGRRYMKHGDREDRDAQFEHFDRSLAQLVPMQLKDGTYKYQWPEARYHEFKPTEPTTFELVPNDHTPLLWTQANVLRALAAFERTAYAIR